VLSHRGRGLISTTSQDIEFENKNIVFKRVKGGKQYAEVLVNGKTGSRHIPLIQSIPYIKECLSNHPSRNNCNPSLFVGLSRNSMGSSLVLTVCMEFTKTIKKSSFQSY
jgi:integrase/recombinase XerD